uniref:Retrovirus-related Pol polyprotein from transposon TNT 1-94 n=1 Tax=Tanacetum cinerariifolium TaxID=118510 RepID=A0A6L2P0J9_TANCI|nr:retrovirus-related Pol polyprotein from transposon TNT 1-94 [Tanacetum cinerariifolium]
MINLSPQMMNGSPNDGPSVGKADAMYGQWVDITMKKVYKLLSMIDNDEMKHVLDYTHVDLHYVEDQKKNLKKTEKSPDVPKPYFDKKTDSSTEQLLLTLMEEAAIKKSLSKLKAQSPLKPTPKKTPMILKPFKESKYCRFIDHHSDHYEFYPGDHLGNFDEKVDDEFFLGYSLVAKAFRVFNIRRQEIEETVHVTFSEDDEVVSQSSTKCDAINFNENTSFPDDEFLKPKSKVTQCLSNTKYFPYLLEYENTTPSESPIFRIGSHQDLFGLCSLHGIYGVKAMNFLIMFLADMISNSPYVSVLAEAEYVVVARCYAQILWIKSQLANYDVLYDKVPIFGDNTSAISISNNPVLHSRTKHIDIRCHFIKDHILKGDIELYFVPTDLQLADIFTKPLVESSFTRLVAKLVTTVIYVEYLKEFWYTTEPKAPTNLKSKMKIILPSSKPKYLYKVMFILPKKQVTETQHAEDTVATANATKSLVAFELVEEQVNQPLTADAEKVLNHNVEEEMKDTRLVSMGDVTFKQIMDEYDQKNKAAQDKAKSLYDTESEIKIIKSFQVVVASASLHFNLGSQRSFLDDLGVIDITPIDVKEGDASESGLHSMLDDDLESLTKEAPPINDENALVLHTSEAKSSEEDISRKKEIDDEPPAKKLKFLIPTTKIPSPTPLKTIKPESLSKPDTQTPLRDESKRKCIAIKELLKDIMPFKERGLVPKISSLKSFVIPEGPLSQENVMAQHKEMKRLADLKAKKEKSKKSLKKLLKNSSTIKAQKQKMAEHEAKRQKMFNEYNHQITHRVDQLPTTKISYRLSYSKEATMRITRANDSMNVTVYDRFRLKNLGFSEWLEVYYLASKSKVKSNDLLLQSLRAKFEWVLTQAKALGIPPPSEFSTFRLSVLVVNKKRKRSLEILKEVFVKKNVVVDGMYRNLVPPLGIEGKQGLVIKEPESGIFFYNGN